VEHQSGLGGFREAHHHVLEHARRLTAAVREKDVALANTAQSYLAFWQGDCRGSGVEKVNGSRLGPCPSTPPITQPSRARRSS
jgi:hypothetical protein